MFNAVVCCSEQAWFRIARIREPGPALPLVDLDDGERLLDTAWPIRGSVGNYQLDSLP